MNQKSIGEKGQNCVIGELSKWDISIGVMLSDNLPFDLIALYNDKLYKIQVKTSTHKENESSLTFRLRSTNWHKKTDRGYTQNDCDIIICYDLKGENTYLLRPIDFVGKKSLNISQKETGNKQKKNLKLHDDFVISEKRIKEVFI